MTGPRAAAVALSAALFAAGCALAQNVVVLPPSTPLSPADGRAIEQALLAAPEFPFPADVMGASDALASPDPKVQAAADAALSRAAIQLAREEHGLIANPAAVDPNWTLKAPYDARADFNAARADGRIAQWAKSLWRRDPGYLGLRSAWGRYEQIRARGGWKALPPGLELRHGSHGHEVLALRARLAAEGYRVGSEGDANYDSTLAEAVAEFQTRHGLKPTGVLSKATVEALDVPVETRLASLAANLERARWLPDQLPPDRIEADVAGAEVTLFEDAKPALVMRAIVGDAKHQTPLFTSHVSDIVFNPPWHVPTSIAKAELWPKQARSPTYFSRHGYSVINGQIVQRAGPQSALGRIKFEIPNPFAVYLHDTPGKALFEVDSRGRSHGCVRLQKPNELAVALLSDQGWDAARVQKTIDDLTTRWVKPDKAIPVFLVYRTAVTTDDGPAIFRSDLYGWDAKLASALASVR